MGTAMFIITISIALSYGWGMRGSLIGADKGAVLPGALLGMFLALMSGEEVLRENFVFLAAAGAVGMAYGGTETYGQTLGFIVHRGEPDYAPLKGYAGVFIKGALWQGICGAVLGVMLSAAGGVYYKPVELVIMLAAVPFLQALGVQIFNMPYDKEKGEFPKIYFSLDRREEWGGNVIALAAFLFFILAHKDYYAFFFSLVGIIGGGAGFSIGMAIYDLMNHPLKNGKYLFGSFNDKLSGWKTMELTFGAVAGLAFAVYFAATKNTMLRERLDMIASNGGVWNPLGKGADALARAWVILMAVLLVLYLFEDKIGEHRLDLYSRPLLYILPMAGILLGGRLTAELTAFSFLVFLAAEKTVIDRGDKFSKKQRIALGVVYALFTLASIACQVFGALPPIAYVFVYTLYYIVSNSITSKHYGPTHIVVDSYFILQTIWLTAMVLIY